MWLLCTQVPVSLLRWRRQYPRREAGASAVCLRPLAEPRGPKHQRELHAAAQQVSVGRGHFFADVCIGIGEVAKRTNLRDNVGAFWLHFMSVQGEQFWQRMIVRWMASRLVRGVLLVLPNIETESGVPSLLRVWRSALQVRDGATSFFTVVRNCSCASAPHLGAVVASHIARHLREAC